MRVNRRPFPCFCQTNPIFVRFFADIEIPCSPQSLEMVELFKRLNGSQIAGAQYDGVFPLVALGNQREAVRA